MPKQLLLLLDPAIAVGLTIVGFLARDWFKTRTSGRYMTAEACTRCRERCRADLARELEAGDKTFGEVKHDLKMLKKANMATALALYQICKTIPEADCGKLEEVVAGLVD